MWHSYSAVLAQCAEHEVPPRQETCHRVKAVARYSELSGAQQEMPLVEVAGDQTAALRCQTLNEVGWRETVLEEVEEEHREEPR